MGVGRATKEKNTATQEEETDKLVQTTTIHLI